MNRTEDKKELSDFQNLNETKRKQLASEGIFEKSRICRIHSRFTIENVAINYCVTEIYRHLIIALNVIITPHCKP